MQHLLGICRTFDALVDLLHALPAQGLYLGLQGCGGDWRGLQLGLPDFFPPPVNGSALLCHCFLPNLHRLQALEDPLESSHACHKT